MMNPHSEQPNTVNTVISEQPSTPSPAQAARLKSKEELAKKEAARKAKLKPLKAYGGRSASILLSSEAEEILEHTKAFYEHRLGLSVSTGLIVRRALAEFIAEVDEMERLYRKKDQTQWNPYKQTEVNTLNSLAGPHAEIKINLPSIKLHTPYSVFPLWEDRRKIRVKGSTKNFQGWLLKSLKGLENDKYLYEKQKEDTRRQYLENTEDTHE